MDLKTDFRTEILTDIGARDTCVSKRSEQCNQNVQVGLKSTSSDRDEYRMVNCSGRGDHDCYVCLRNHERLTTKETDSNGHPKVETDKKPFLLHAWQE